MKDYDFKILEMVVNKYLDETVSVTENNLGFLQANRDEIVWKLTTKIYSESGQKVELSTVLDIVNRRISNIKNQLLSEQQGRVEQNRRAAQEQAQKTNEEVRLSAEKEAYFKAQVTQKLEKFGEDPIKAHIFVKIREILCDLFELSANEITEETEVFSFNLYRGGGLWSVPERITDYKVEESSSYYKVFITPLSKGDEVDAQQDYFSIYYALEEEFDIEIQDEEAEELCTYLGTLRSVVEYIAHKKCDR